MFTKLEKEILLVWTGKGSLDCELDAHTDGCFPYGEGVSPSQVKAAFRSVRRKIKGLKVSPTITIKLEDMDLLEAGVTENLFKQLNKLRRKKCSKSKNYKMVLQ